MGHEGSSPSCSYEGHEGHEEEGSHEACHEGSSPGRSNEGHEGHEEEGSHEARHEGSSSHESHEGQEVKIIIIDMASCFCSRAIHTFERSSDDQNGCVLEMNDVK